MWLMEELTVEILTDGGGRTSMADVEEICASAARSASCRTRARKFVCKPITAPISPPRSAVWSRTFCQLVGTNSVSGAIRKTARLAGGTWPWGEAHVEPVPGTANGKVVWK